MTSRTAAARYARAALDVATRESADLEQLGRELDDFLAFFRQQPVLERLMLNPAVPAPRKRGAMEQLT
jgi:F0F1-type ATP synthase delta subunit